MTKFTDYTVVPASMEHTDDLLARIRPIDAVETAAASGMTAEEALYVSVAMSARAFSAIQKSSGKVILMFGVGNIDECQKNTGCVWMVSSTLIERPDIRREFIRQSRATVAEYLAPGFDLLLNRVHVQNDIAIRWLKWLGFSFADQEHLVNGQPFVTFWKVNHV
jgi:hypothetical protein